MTNFTTGEDHATPIDALSRVSRWPVFAEITINNIEP
jgi:hypothetical protein